MSSRTHHREVREAYQRNVDELRGADPLSKPHPQNLLAGKEPLVATRLFLIIAMSVASNRIKIVMSIYIKVIRRKLRLRTIDMACNQNRSNRKTKAEPSFPSVCGSQRLGRSTPFVVRRFPLKRLSLLPVDTKAGTPQVPFCYSLRGTLRLPVQADVH